MSNFKLPRKKTDSRCSCVDGQYECGFCRGIKRQRIWNGMSEEQRAYDRRFDPSNSAVLDSGRGIDLDLYEQGCSCHICPPCSYCMSLTEEDLSGTEVQP